MTLLRRGVTTDISLEAERIDAPRGVKYFLWLPTKDHAAPTMPAIDLGVKTLRWMLDHGDRVYVHCKSGHGRAPTLLAAFLIRESRMRLNEAVAFIKQKRPEVHLERGQITVLRLWSRQ
jgi:protein-tyrosine phosphatase